MPSLRKKVAGFMRQLSISNLAGAVESIGLGEHSLQSPQSLTQEFPGGCFITRYLNGLETKQEGPPILHGRNPEELPSKQLENFQENEEIFAAYTGPDSGLTAVNLQQKHLSISDTDIDYIDMLDQNEQYRSGEFRIEINKASLFLYYFKVKIYKTLQDQQHQILKLLELPIGLSLMKTHMELQLHYMRKILQIILIMENQ